MEYTEELQLIRRAQARDQQAFAKLVDLYWQRVQRWLYGMSQNSHTAEDLAQEVFLKAWTALPALQVKTSLRPWLFRIARNCFLDNQRGIRPSIQALPETVSGKEAGPVDGAIGRESEELLREACARLPLQFRAAFLLWTFENCSYTQLGQMLGVTEETARWRVHKARRFLFKKLGPHLDQMKW